MELVNDQAPRVPKTEILSVQDIKPPSNGDLLKWFHSESVSLTGSQNLLRAAEALRTSNCPVAFPTETVYGLGADATRSESVRGIYVAKQRPADNPLIVHFSTLSHLEKFLKPSAGGQSGRIPSVYRPLISKFWPGPLTILLPAPSHLPLAKEVTHSLQTFGARIPSSSLARLLIGLADRPIAAPSANASGKPSPTTADHVFNDLEGKIELILDGGSCNVGVESTVVDGLSSPPAILRPGGVGIDDIRACGGIWADVTIGYHDKQQEVATINGSAPRAPGMKYRHYAPKANVILLEPNLSERDAQKVLKEICGSPTGHRSRVGIVRTRNWTPGCGLPTSESDDVPLSSINGVADASRISQTLRGSLRRTSYDGHEIIDIQLGHSTEDIARNLFSTLRLLDQVEVDSIIIEGISDAEGDDLAAAVMNRLRKAAEVDVRWST